MEYRIQNFIALAQNELRKDALSIAEAGYAAIDVGAALERTLRIEGDTLQVGEKSYPLAERRVYFVGIGKCAFVAASAIEKLFGDRLTGGIVLDVAINELQKLNTLMAYVGSHPLPSEANVVATTRIIELLTTLTPKDLVITLISGGGSALLCSPLAPMTFTDEAELFSTLTSHGASIQEMNTVRKHTSRMRGGGLAFAAHPAEVLSLIVSDVPGDDIEYIASGPTVLDSSTVADAQAVLAKYHLHLPELTEFIESPKDKKYFERVTNLLFLSSRDALSAMQDAAKTRGYSVEIVDEHFSGEAREIGRSVVQKLRDAAPRTVLLCAGESTVTLGGKVGEGGRNQEMALAALASIGADEILLPFASDGHDNTDHAGAIADSLSHAHADEKKLSAEEYLGAHRSYDFFKTTGDALVTGYTGSNVSDLIIAMKK